MRAAAILSPTPQRPAPRMHTELARNTRVPVPERVPATHFLSVGVCVWRVGTLYLLTGTCTHTGYGRKSLHARMQPPTLSLEDSDAAASAAHAPYTRLCAAEAAEAYIAQRARPVRMHSAYAPRHSAPTWWASQEHVCRHALHARAAGLDTADHLLFVCEVAVCTRLGD